jgi:hypothetical protein
MAKLDLTPPVLDLTLYRGDDSTIQVTLKDDAGEPVSLSPTAAWDAQLRLAPFGDAVADCTVDATGVDEGVLYITFPDTSELSETSFFYDVQSNTEGRVKTHLRGRITIMGDVTVVG